MDANIRKTIPQRALLNLLEHTEIPPDRLDEVAQLRQLLARDLSPAEVKAAIRDFASLVSRLQVDAIHEKAEMERFLLKISDRIRTFASNLAEVLGNQTASQNRELDFRTGLETHFQEIRSSVRETGEIDSLKATVQGSLDAIESKVMDYLGGQSKRFERSQKTIRELSQRLRHMEADASALREQIAKEREQAARDALTGLPNRLALDERMPEEYARWRRYGQPLTLCMLDVDHFKQVNDQHGHGAGDKVLAEIASAVRGNVRKSDFVARYGGEELLLLMPGVNLKQGLVAAEKIRARIETMRFMYDGERVPVTVSIGVAEYGAGDESEAVFDRADAALYFAKESGRNQVIGEHLIVGKRN